MVNLPFFLIRKDAFEIEAKKILLPVEAVFLYNF
jgi:hypothetical protein